VRAAVGPQFQLPGSAGYLLAGSGVGGLQGPAPILDQVADELEGSGVGLLLTDARGQVVDRRAADTGILARLDRIELAPGFLYGEGLIGTNAIGTAIAQQAPSVVAGTEHFADALTSMACAATPVTDGAGELLGVIDLTCAAEHFNPLLLPFAKRAAREIGHRLREGADRRRLTARSWLSLTDTERAVAHLAAQGLSSRMVADRMRLPLPAVRSHLRRTCFGTCGRSPAGSTRRCCPSAAWSPR
jgi:transcriptional regulator of acetoin/glycerol metabolism